MLQIEELPLLPSSPMILLRGLVVRPQGGAVVFDFTSVSYLFGRKAATPHLDDTVLKAYTWSLITKPGCDGSVLYADLTEETTAPPYEVQVTYSASPPMFKHGSI